MGSDWFHHQSNLYHFVSTLSRKDQCDKLEAIERGEIDRLVVSMPPRAGKSLWSSICFPGWFLGRHPRRAVAIASYAQGLSERFSGAVRNTGFGAQWNSK